MLFYERLSKERKEEEHGEETATTTMCCEQSDDVPNVKVELTKDLADVSIPCTVEGASSPETVIVRI